MDSQLPRASVPADEVDLISTDSFLLSDYLMLTFQRYLLVLLMSWTQRIESAHRACISSVARGRIGAKLWGSRM